MTYLKLKRGALRLVRPASILLMNLQSSADIQFHDLSAA